MGPRLEAPDEELLRTVHPDYVVGGEVTYRAFVPIKTDGTLLSVDEGKKTTAEQARERRIALGRKCVAVAVVIVAEVEEVGLCAYEDPIEENPAHAVVDFALQGSDPRALASHFADVAQDRGLRAQG